ARAIYPHARAGRPVGSEEPAHAYLMLLRVEVAAFHPAASHRQNRRGVRSGRTRAPKSPRRRLVSVALFLGLAARACHDAGRLLAATLPYGVRTFLDACTPRLPDSPHPGIVTCDNRRLLAAGVCAVLFFLLPISQHDDRIPDHAFQGSTGFRAPCPAGWCRLQHI